MYNPNHDCRIIICPEDDPRKISIPPRDSDEWIRHYKKRKIGEGLFSYYDELLGLERVNYTSFEDYAIYVTMADITILTLAIIAEKLGIPKFLRDFKIVGFYIMRELFEEIPVDPEILMLVIEILHHFGLTIEMLEETLKKRERSYKGG